MNVNMQDKMELTVNAPKSDKGSYFSHGIETIGPGCTLIVEDAEVNSKAGKVDVTVSRDPGAGLSAMGIYCTIFEAKGNSKIWAEANTVKFNPEIPANEESMAIACRLLDASGSSYIFADASDFNSKQKGEGIEIQDEWYLADDAVIESYGANENAITTGTSTIIELRSGYSPKLEFGPDESDVDVVYTLKGQEYQKNTYAKISNKNTKIPVTGDTNNMMLWVVLAIMAAGIATGTILKIKRTDK